MADDTSGTKNTALHHIEDAQKSHPLGGGAISQQEQEDAERLQEKYNIPLRAVLEAHLEEDPKMVRRVMRKVDLRLVPMLSLLYMWAFIDRSNLGNVSSFLCVEYNESIRLTFCRRTLQG